MTTAPKKKKRAKPIPRVSVQRAASLKRVLAATILENTSDTAFAFYFNHREGVANRGCCGYTGAEIARGGLDFLVSITTPDMRKRLQQAVEYLQASGERVINLPLEIIPKHASHLRRHVLAMLSPLFDGRQRVVGLQGVYRDDTEFQATERALKDSESRFMDVVESAHDLVWAQDLEGHWTYLNSAAKSIYGSQPDELIGKPFGDFVHPDCLENDLLVFEQLLRGKEVMHHETVHLRADGTQRIMSFNAKPRMDRNWNIIGTMGTARDITEQKEHQRQLEHFANYDALTGIYNRHHFQEELERAVAHIGRGPLHSGLLYIDLDNFKYINDIVGHAAGDKLLVEISVLLRDRLRHGDVLARFGGDEFTVLLQEVDPERLRIAAESYCRLLADQSFTYESKTFNLSASIGAALLSDHESTPGDFLGHADMACTLAKSRGRNQFHVYDPSDESKAIMVADVGWAGRIRQAIERDEFTLFYQPIVQVSDRTTMHHEALLRLRSGQKGDELIGPGAFLPAAERFGLMQAIDQWVITRVIAQAGELIRNGAGQHFAINLSGKAFEYRTLLPLISRKLHEHSVPPSFLTFEITEQEAISHFLDAKVFITELKALGCQFALDDFGSGFSSYSYLKALPVDFLKIDGSFVRNLASDAVDQALVKSMNEVAHALGKKTIAEFVEDERTLTMLREFGVDYAQGYHLGRPAPTFVASEAA
ncbi:MAG: EAL domain-containing protein [Sulfuricaulis sp.]|uniref:putative bifunctional diguanylate cyclase/phosphodiesterase n=1 Tax=Sulfuricaulis sp. TaxID=2003553 RepID=UPI003C4673C3